MAKKIVICFDGTTNHPRDSKQEREWFGGGEIEDNGITNILKLHILFGGNLENTSKDNKQQCFYYSGVGTYGNKFQKIFNTLFSPETKDVKDIIITAGYDLKQNYQEGDEIFIFGFSRGAAIARRFASVLNNYIKVKRKKPPVRFLGVFDTVAAIGFPNLDSDEKPVSDVVFENGSVSPHVQEALHLVSLDENRNAFQPTLINKDDRVTEIWMPRAHADVGGGFWFDGLSDIALEFMLKEIKKRKLGIKVKKIGDVVYSDLVAGDGSYRIDIEDLVIKPLIKGKAHPKDRWGPFAYATLSPRDIRVNIYDKKNRRDVTSTKDFPLIHCKVGERIKVVTDYRPRALKGIEHIMVKENGKFGKPQTGLMPYFE